MSCVRGVSIKSYNKNLELSALKVGLDLANSGFCSFAEHKPDKGINHNNNNQEVGSKSQSISDLIKEGKMSAKFSESCVFVVLRYTTYP